MLSRLRGQLEEMQSRAQFLGLAKRYLQVSPAFPPPPGLGPLKPYQPLGSVAG